LGEFAADFGFFDFEVTGEDGSGECERDTVACFEVGGTAYDLVCFFSCIDLAEAEAIGIGMGDVAEDLGDDDVIISYAGGGDAFDFDTG
jgi:hypothetical protein